jgi:hypothetical protein
MKMPYKKTSKPKAKPAAKKPMSYKPMKRKKK